MGRWSAPAVVGGEAGHVLAQHAQQRRQCGLSGGVETHHVLQVLDQIAARVGGQVGGVTEVAPINGRAGLDPASFVW